MLIPHKIVSLQLLYHYHEKISFNFKAEKVFLLLKGGEIYSPMSSGIKDILTCNEKIIKFPIR